jgi:Tfp pilus assembly protein PilF
MPFLKPLTPTKAALVLLLACLGVYANGLKGGLVHFDDAFTLEQVAEGGTIGRTLQRWGKTLIAHPTKAPGKLFRERPLRRLSLIADAFLYGGALWGFRLTNLLLHFAAAFFVFLIFSRLLKDQGWALAGALLFAIHPLQSESVVYIAGRRDVLYGALTLASFYAWLVAYEDQRPRLYGIAGVAFLGALLSKPAALSLPLLCAAYVALTTKKKIDWSRPPGGWPPYAAGLVVCAGIAALHYEDAVSHADTYGIAYDALWYGGDAFTHLMTVGRVLLHALLIMLAPLTLRADYSWQVFAPAQGFTVLVGAACWAGVGYALLMAWQQRQQKPLQAFAVWFIALAYLPMLPVLPTLHNQELFAEHWLYLPLVGFALLAALSARDYAKVPTAKIKIIVALVLCLFSGRTMLRNLDWRSDKTLWARTVRNAPKCGRAHLQLGMTQFRRGQLDEAEKNFAKAITLRPKWAEGYAHLAKMQLSRNELKEARVTAKLGLATPQAGLAKGRLTYILGVADYRQSKFTSARDHFNSAVREVPQPHWPALDGYAYLAHRSGRPEEAEKLYKEVLRHTPRYAPTLNNYAVLMMERGDLKTAGHLLRRAVRSAPRYLPGRINMGRVAAADGQLRHAVAQFSAAARLAPENPIVWESLARVHIADGNRREALIAARKLAALVPGKIGEKYVKQAEALGR